MEALGLQESSIYCPYCGESIDVLLNPEDVGVDYIEDCQVCCRPIEFHLREESGGWLQPEVRSEFE